MSRAHARPAVSVPVSGRPRLLSWSEGDAIIDRKHRPLLEAPQALPGRHRFGPWDQEISTRLPAWSVS
jgi:hypothetical protein